MRDFWSTCDSQKFKGSVLTEYMTECFMYSVKHMLPEKITEDWISDSEIENIIEEIKNKGIVYSANYPYNDDMVLGVFDRDDFRNNSDPINDKNNPLSSYEIKLLSLTLKPNSFNILFIFT